MAKTSCCKNKSNQSHAKTFIGRGFIVFIRLYQLAISPLLGQRCRFYPTCSQYAITAIDEHGSLRGTLLIIKRLAKCHPFHSGGIDLVPTPKNNTE